MHLWQQIADSAPGEGAGDNEAEFKEADATLPYAAGEFSSTDDEDETGWQILKSCY